MRWTGGCVGGVDNDHRAWHWLTRTPRGQEPWIRALCAFHVLMYACAYATTRSDTAQAAVFVTTTGLLYASRHLNRAAGARWAVFSTQNYFDEQGLFAGVVWCAPLILLQTAMVVGFLVRAARLLVRVKRLELGQRARSARQEDSAQAAGQEGKAQGGAVRRRQGRRIA
jgi:hypothetical protein